MTTLLVGLKRQRTEFEDAVSRQYREIVKPRLTNLMLATEAPSPHVVRRSLPDVYAYLDLCNEQVFLRLSGRVSKRMIEILLRLAALNVERG